MTIYYTRTAKRIYENYAGKREIIATAKQDQSSGLWTWFGKIQAPRYQFASADDALNAFCESRKLSHLISTKADAPKADALKADGVKLSKTSKLDGILSWSLEAIDTCPGSIGADGQLVDACKGCYATAGNYRYPNVKAPRIHNREDWKRDEWVDDMVKALDSSRYFRWFDSGDMYDIRLAEKIYQVMLRASFCTFWLPTRMHKFEKFRAIIDKMNALPNCVVRFSSDSVTGEWVAGAYTSTIVPSIDAAGTAVACRAYENEGKCNGCRACWNKAVPVIAYVAHGQKMQKVIKLALAA